MLRKTYLANKSEQKHMSRGMRFPTMWYVRPAKTQTVCAYAQSDQSLCLSLEYSMSIKLLTEHHLKFLSLKGSCTNSSESRLLKMPHYWKSHAAAHICLRLKILHSSCYPKTMYSLRSHSSIQRWLEKAERDKLNRKMKILLHLSVVQYY